MQNRQNVSLNVFFRDLPIWNICIVSYLTKENYGFPQTHDETIKKQNNYISAIDMIIYTSIYNHLISV